MSLTNSPFEYLKKMLTNYETFDKAIKSFISKSLELNFEYKTGSTRRVIFLLTENSRKLVEYQKVFCRYGIEVIQTPVLENPVYITRLLQSGEDNVLILSVFREESNVFCLGTNKLAYKKQGELVENKTKLTSYVWRSVAALQKKDYEYSTHGHIDLRKSRPNDSTVFGWDDIFVLQSVGKTYHELFEDGYKVSSRDMAVSGFISDFIHYKKLVDLQFTPQHQKRVIDFSNSVSDFVSNSTLLNNRFAKTLHVDSFLQFILNGGVFFKSPNNRREKIYWFPVMNGGIPFTPKKDLVHELTYIFHDFGHQPTADLIFNGEDSQHYRQIYIAHRMMSEAITMVLADMLFVDSLKRSGVSYDYSKRKIYPLFEKLRFDFTDKVNLIENIKKLLHANVSYCLRGDDSEYKQLLNINGSGNKELEDFKTKYAPFFVEDFRWTEHNYINMTSRSEELKKWWSIVSKVKKFSDVQFETISEFSQKLDTKSGDIIEQIFEVVFREKIQPAFEKQIAPDAEAVRLKRAFFRYISGQMGIFARFGFLEEAWSVQKRILNLLSQMKEGATLEQIEVIRSIYEEFVDILVEKNLISIDDGLTYREVYPLFDPFYVFYDAGKESYEDLSSLSRKILK